MYWRENLSSDGKPTLCSLLPNGLVTHLAKHTEQFLELNQKWHFLLIVPWIGIVTVSIITRLCFSSLNVCKDKWIFRFWLFPLWVCFHCSAEKSPNILRGNGCNSDAHRNYLRVVREKNVFALRPSIKSRARREVRKI